MAARSGRLLNGGKISLLNPADRSAAYDTKLSNEEEGFTLNYVLEGDYILRVDMASEIDYREVPVPAGVPPTRIESHVVRTYGRTEQSVHVGGDVSELIISVPEQSADKAQSAQLDRTLTCPGIARNLLLNL